MASRTRGNGQSGANSAVLTTALEERRRGGRGHLYNLADFCRRKPLGAAGGLLMLAAILVAVFADALAPYDPIRTGLTQPYYPTSTPFWLGTDELGRDELSRLIHGARTSVLVGIASVALGTLAGTILGLVSGFFGGKLDLVLQRVVDSIQAFPAIILALVIMAMLGGSLVNVIIAIGVVLIPLCSRVVRGTVLSVKENQYIEAARAIGCQSHRILRYHILPNVAAPVIVVATAWLGSAIIIEASLSFLGMGTPPPTPSWGQMLSRATTTYLLHAPMLAIYPGLAISLAVLGINFLGDAIRDVWDPRLRRA